VGLFERESIENWETEVVIGEERGSMLGSGEPGEEKLGEVGREGEEPEPEAYLSLRLNKDRKPIEGD